MGKAKKKRALALFLCAALIVSQMGITSFAEEAHSNTGVQQEHQQEPPAQSGTDESTGDYGEVKTASGSDAAREHTQTWEDGDSAVQSLDNGGSVSTPSNASRPEKEPVDEDGTVIAFTPLDKKIQKQETEAGTALEDLTLPDSLEVSVYTEDEAAGSDSVTVQQLLVQEWSSTPDYNGEPGTYVFTPKLAEDYPLRDGVKAPEITVTVKEAALNSLEKKILHWSWGGDNVKNLSGSEEAGRWEMSLPGVSEKNQESFDKVVSLLPDTIVVSVEQTATDSNAEEKTELTLGGWVCKVFLQDDSRQWPIQGEYTFTASLPEGYILAPDITPLEVKVTLGGGNALDTNTGDFTVMGQSTGYSYDSATQTLTIDDGAELTIQNTEPDTPTTDKIVVVNGAEADITLDGVNIDVSRIYEANALDVTGANVTLNLEGKNTLISGYSRAGVLVPENSALTINGTGKLTVRGGQVRHLGGAGIGANHAGTCGSITIKGGKVDTMAVGEGGAGIGLGGWGGRGGSISISEGRVISAGGGEGSFAVSDAANIKITGGIVETPKDTRLSDEANVTKENCIIFENHNGQVYGTFDLTAGYTVPAGDILTLFPGTALNIDQNAVLTINGILLNQGTVTGTLGGIGRVASDGTISPGIPPSLSPLQQGYGVIDVNEGKAVLYTNWYLVGDQLYGYDASKGITLTGTTNTNTVTVQSESEVNVKLDNVDIENTNDGACSFALLGNAACHLTLADDSTNILKSGSGRAGLEVQERNGQTAKLIIDGTGSLTVNGGNGGAGIGGGDGGTGGDTTISGGNLTATGGYYRGAWSNENGGAGIGGGNGGAGGKITISGGSLTATGGDDGAGIGGGQYGAGGNITISGGNLTANGSYGSAGIGGGYRGADGTFSTGESGSAFIVALSISDKSNQESWSGVIFEGNAGKVYGSNPITLTTDAEIPKGKTLTVEEGNTLMLGNGMTLTNNGDINVNEGGTLDITNGFFNNFGTLGGVGTKPNESDYNNKKSTVVLTVSSAFAVYGDTVTLAATIAEQENNILSRRIPQKTVFFYCDGTEIGSAAVKNNQASVSITLTGADWKPGSHSLTAKYTGGDDQLLPATSEPVTLTVKKVVQAPKIVTVSSYTATYGGAVPTIIPLSGVKDNAKITYSAVSNTSGSSDTTDVASISGTTIKLLKAGTFYVKAVIGATDYYDGKTVYSDAITVSKADSKFTATIRKDGAITSDFTYDDTIDVEISGIQVKTPTNRNALNQDRVYLFAVDPKSSPDSDNAIASAEVTDGSATLTYDTSGKGVAIGKDQTLWIAYGGSDGLNPVTQKVFVTLGKKPLTAMVDSHDSSAEKFYDETASFSGVKLVLNNVAPSDTVTATANGSANDFNVGDSKTFTAASVALDGADADWYNLALSVVSGAVKITKAFGSEIPGSVTGAYTGDGHTFTYTINPIEGAEYSKDNSIWQNSSAFTGFVTVSQATTFYARMKEDDNHTPGNSKSSDPVTFIKLDNTSNPTLNYQVSGATGSKKITITEVSGCEYSFDGGINWGDTNTQTFSTDGKPTIGIRYQETETHHASSGTMQEEDLKNKEQAVPNGFTLTFAYNGNGRFTATIPTVFGGEYSFDGLQFSGANTKADCQPNTEYTGYVRFAARDGYNASPTVSDTKTSPGKPASGGSEHDDSGSSQADVTTPAKPDTPTTGTVTVISGKTDQNGSAVISDEQVANAISQAEKAAGQSGQAKNDVAIAVNLPGAITGATLGRTTLDRLISTGVKSFKLNFTGVSMSFDLPALKGMEAKTTGVLTVGASQATGLTGDALAAIGTRPAYSLTVSWQADGRTDYLDSFGLGRVSVAMAYAPAGGESDGSLYAVYVDGSGKVEWMDQSGYDRNSRIVIVQTDHFSTFGVGYKTPPAFADTVNHWAKADIDFVAARGLLTGTGNNQFSPDTAMTRGMFVTALGRLAGVNPDSYKIGKFTDVKADAYYAPYVNWAAEKGIVNGIGNVTFAPDQTVNRQEMAVIMANYAKACGYTVPKTRRAVTFADSGSIAVRARAAVNVMQMAGVINGRDGKRFDPAAAATRAEAAATLHRYVELVIDPATAQGWTQNDAGRWLYYENGIAVTGWKKVDRTWYYLDTSGLMQSDGWKQIQGTWYYLYADGSMAVSTSIDGYEVGPDGARKK